MEVPFTAGHVNFTIKERAGKTTYFTGKCVCGKVVRRQMNWGVRDNPNTSCGCKKNKARTGDKSHVWKGFGELSSGKWSIVKRVAKTQEHDLKITMQFAWELFLKQGRKCALTGRDLTMLVSGRGNTHKETASLDRIDSSGHYTEDNVQWLHKDVNIMKNAFSEVDFIEQAKLVIKYHHQMQSEPKHEQLPQTNEDSNFQSQT